MHIREDDILNVYFLASHHMCSGLAAFVRGNKQVIQLSVCLCDRGAAKQLLFVSPSSRGSISSPSHPSLTDLGFYHLGSSHAHGRTQPMRNTRLGLPYFVYDIPSGIGRLS